VRGGGRHALRLTLTARPRTLPAPAYGRGAPAFDAGSESEHAGVEIPYGSRVEFRSLVVPLMAVAMNLLAVGAAYRPVVAVFQWG
jgi:hypothetical protein